MIVDRIENWKRYFNNAAWQRAFDFLGSLSADSDEKKTELDGDEVFGRVMSYATCGPNEAVLEAHRDYIDVQMTLSGSEGIDWFPTQSLESSGPYNAQKDVEYFKRPGPAPARVNVFPGTFVVLFPEDAHMPKQMTGSSSEQIKKVVVKLKMSRAGLAS